MGLSTGRVLKELPLEKLLWYAQQCYRSVVICVIGRRVRFHDGDNVRWYPDFWKYETTHALREKLSEAVQH